MSGRGTRAAPGRAGVLACLLLLAVLVSGCAAPAAQRGTAPARAVAPDGPAPDAWGDGETQRARRPLAGRVVVLDAGHQRGNRHFPRQINRLVQAGGFRKPCNTTGTATASGYPESTVAWRVTRILQRRLQRWGAEVVLVRTSDRDDRWGPCIDVRGRAGNRIDADLKVSVHGDGNLARGARGFHVIVPTSRRGWTDDIARPSLRAGRRLRAALDRAGLERSTYLGGGSGLVRRGDLGTLNLSDVPTVMVELGNLRHPTDAHRLTSPRGQRRHALALARGIRAHLRR